MSESATMAMELLSGTAWVALTNDVIYPVRVSYGIMGNDALDRVAQTGEMTFSLNNSEYNNSGIGSIGYYSPGHPNCMSGFATGGTVRLSFQYNENSRTKFYGRIPLDGIQVTTGTKGTRRTNVTVRDWMEQAATQEISVISYENDQKISSVVGSIVAGMPVQPGTASYEDGISVFPASFDTSGSKTKVMTEMQKVAVSELGYIYITHDSESDEILKVEDRQTRNEIVYTDSQISGEFKITDVNNTMLAGEATTKKNYNRIVAKVYPRTYDDAYVTLYSLQSPVSIPADTTLVLDGMYRDPENNAYSVSGKEMQTPVINTDYTFNTADDDSGVDISDKLTVSAEYGASKVRYTLVNTSTTKSGYVTKLNARGKGIYLYEPIYYTAETDGAAAIGAYELTLDLKYHDSLNEAISFADSFKSLFENADAISIDKVTSIANSSVQQMVAFINRDVGSLVNISEGVTGFSTKGHFIQGVQFTVQQGGIIRYTWYLKPSAASPVYWRLDVAYRSELDLYTILAI
jgi:hypothetical protein